MSIDEYRYSVILPLDKKSLQQIQDVDITTATRMRILEIGIDQFSELRVYGIFRAINTVSDSMIVEYEETLLQPNQMPKAIELLRARFMDTSSDYVNHFSSALYELCNEAIEIGMPLYFVL